MSRFKKITKVIVNALTVFLLILLLFVIYGKVVTIVSKNKYPNYFGYTIFEVASGSMQPTLELNDVILVKITKENLLKDDIIAFVNGEEIITHRIVYIDGDNLVVKGDNNNTADKPITREEVIGKVTKIYPKLGVWKKVLTNPKILILIFVTLVLFDFALSYNEKDNKKIKEDKKIKNNNEEIIIKKIEMPKENNSKTDSEKLLEITRKIDIETINRLLEGTELELNKVELDNLKKEIDNIEEKEEEKIDIKENLSQKEQDFVNYTIRLDLNEIRKKIDEKIQ